MSARSLDLLIWYCKFFLISEISILYHDIVQKRYNYALTSSMFLGAFWSKIYLTEVVVNECNDTNTPLQVMRTETNVWHHSRHISRILCVKCRPTVLDNSKGTDLRPDWAMCIRTTYCALGTPTYIVRMHYITGKSNINYQHKVTM